MRRDAETAAPLGAARSFLRKEVIQPQVPLRLPCYDFTPVADLTVVGCLLAVRRRAEIIETFWCHVSGVDFDLRW